MTQSLVQYVSSMDNLSLRILEAMLQAHQFVNFMTLTYAEFEHAQLKQHME